MAARAVDIMVETGGYLRRRRYYLSEDGFDDFDQFVEVMIPMPTTITPKRKFASDRFEKRSTCVKWVDPIACFNGSEWMK